MPTILIQYALYMCPGTKPFPLNSLHRLVWFSQQENVAILIRTGKERLTKPALRTYREVEEWIDTGQLARVDKETVIPQLRLSDRALSKRYPPSNRRIDPDRKPPSVSAPLEYRQRWLPFLDEITPHLVDVWRRKISLLSLLEPACTKYGVAVNESYQVVYRFLANSCARLSVIPLRFYCGNKGEKRVGKGFNLGRKKTETKRAGNENDNFSPTQEWLRKIRDTYTETVKRGVSTAKAYSTFLNLHCRISTEVIEGELVVTYLPKSQRPTKTQFLTHGPDDDPEEALWRKQLLEKEYEKNHRPLDGQSEPITLRTGLVGHVDASSNDRYLVSAFSRAQTVGTARCIPVIDNSIGYIWGFYVGWRVNKEASRLSALSCASDKVEFCARHSIPIKPGDWYSHLPAEFIADHGEFNCEPVRESFGDLNRSIEYVITGRADLRGRGERTNGLLHDHDANGSTYGRFRQRGEEDPAKAADQNIFDYTRELIRLILYHNNYAPVDHLRTTEMRQAGVPPTRRGILEFCMKNGYHHQIAYNEDDLVLALCPEYTAVVTENGIYPIILRNIDHGDEIILDELRYLGPFATAQRWLETARRNGHRRIRIRMNPNDPRKVWYQDPDSGLHCFTLASRDPLLGRLATVHDLTLRMTDDTIVLASARNLAEEERAKMELQNNAERKVIAKQKREAIQRATGKKGNSSNTKGRRKALQKEVSSLGQSPVPIAYASDTATSLSPSGTSPANVIPLNRKPAPQSDDIFDKWLNGGIS